LSIANVKNLTKKDGRTLNYARAVSLTICVREKNSIFFSLKMGLDRTLRPERLGKDQEKIQDYSGPRGPSGL
jgi:hypothetical protein